MDNKRITIQFGQQIRKYRRQNLKTIEDLAKDTGINKKHVGEIERGNYNTTVENYYKIYKALNIPDNFWRELDQNLSDEDN